MKYLDLTLPSPAGNLACDEALLDLCEESGEDEVLRFWESSEPFVVLGYANRLAREVNVESCHRRGIPILRRCTGGGTVVQGPGCLNYALVLRIEETGPLRSITGANAFVMERHQDVLRRLIGPEVMVQGHTDLALGTRKFSGNAQRRKRRFLLFHGSFLLGFDLRLVEELLPAPPKQPAYRAGRSHAEFLINLQLPGARISRALRAAWGARRQLENVPWKTIEELALGKYSGEEWNLKF